MRVLVVGAGVLGLTVGVRLAEAGHEVNVLARELPLETTSAVAGALWYPYRAFPQDRVLDWSMRSYVELRAIARDFPAAGVAMMPGDELLAETAPDPWWAPAVPDLARLADPPRPYRDGWSFTAPVVEMGVYLPWLQARLVAAGGTVTRMALAGLPDRAPLVVNCAGLGARALAGDSSVTPIRGQVVRVEQIGLDRWILDGSAPTYVVPRSHDIVIGGTDEAGEWDTTPRAALAERMLARAVALVPGLSHATVVAHRVGLRPARAQVRLEVDESGRGRVIHCYGHGGAGVTVSWGCADEVLGLV